MSEVVFWDILVFLEANKTYIELMKGKSVDDKMVYKLTMLNSSQVKNNPQKISKLILENKDIAKIEEIMPVHGAPKIFGGGSGDDKTHIINKNFITDFIRKNVAFNEKIAKWIPRFILYPVVRYSLYFEYLIQKYLIKDTNNIHKETNSRVSKKIRIEKKYLDVKKTTQIERSLRSIVEKKFENIDYERKNNPAHSLISGP
jgi:hypothetical protein